MFLTQATYNRNKCGSQVWVTVNQPRPLRPCWMSVCEIFTLDCAIAFFRLSMGTILHADGSLGACRSCGQSTVRMGGLPLWLAGWNRAASVVDVRISGLYSAAKQ